MYYQARLPLVYLVVLASAPIRGQYSVSLNRQELSAERPKNDIIPGSLQLLGKVPELLRNYQNVYYYGEIKLGTPGDRLRVVFDTGSPSLWVYSGSGLQSWLCLGCWFHTTYHHSRSSTYMKLGKEVAINYVSGYMKGYTSQDVLTIGNLSVPVVFAEATKAPLMSAIREKFDGILGLAPCAGQSCPLYRDLPDPTIQSILSNLSQKTFSVYLDRTGKGNGEITFGGTNQALYNESSLKMHSTSRPYTWSVAIESIWVGDKMVMDYSKSFMEAYVDTGTSLIVGPALDIDMILREIGISFGLQVPCNAICDLPSLSFVIGGEKYTLTSRDYASLRTKPLWGDEICYHGLEGMFQGGKYWILGDVFMGKFYTVFELDGGRSSKIGFANLKKNQVLL